MHTVTYTRKNLATTGPDCYNALLSSPHIATPTEYWTNGWTTHLMSTPTAEGRTVAGVQPINNTIATAHSLAPSSRPSTCSPPSPNSSATTNMRSSTSKTIQPRSHPEASHFVRNSLLAGSASGIASTFVLYPLDVWRTKIQAGAGGRSASALTVLRHTIEHGGLRALYTGVSLPLAAQAVYKGTVFTVNNITQKFILDHRTFENHKMGIIQDGHLTMLDRFWCGVIGGAVNAYLFVTPVEFVRNQLIAQHSKLADGQKVSHWKSGSYDVIRSCIRDHGWISLWRGASMAVARDGIGCGCFFLTMSWTQQALTPVGEVPTFATTVFSGGMSGLAFWVASYPLDTIKTWVQSSDLLTERHVTASQAVRQVLRESGSTGLMQQLFRGWHVAYGRGIPSAAITICVYTFAFRYLSGSQEL